MYYQMFRRNYVPKSRVLGAGVLAFFAGAIAWAMFGDRVKEKTENSATYRKLRREVYDQAAKISDLTQDKYDEMVDSVTSKYATAKGISQNELRDLTDDLKWHWHRIKSTWKSNRYSDNQ